MKCEPVRMLSDREISEIHDSVLYVLQKVGVEFYDDEAVAILDGSSARVEGKRVFFPSQLIERSLGTVESPEKRDIGKREGVHRTDDRPHQCH
jgi:trimethylamine:corrinoid methyltransferase-like protein